MRRSYHQISIGMETEGKRPKCVPKEKWIHVVEEIVKVLVVQKRKEIVQDRNRDAVMTAKTYIFSCKCQ